MISKKLKLLFGISIPLFIIHGIEEYITKFYDNYPLLNFKWTETIFSSVPQASFLTFQIMLWVVLLISFLLIQGGKWQFKFMVFIGFVYLYEVTHILSAIITQRYTSGLITAPLFLILSFFYWKELLKNWHSTK